MLLHESNGLLRDAVIVMATWARKAGYAPTAGTNPKCRVCRVMKFIGNKRRVCRVCRAPKFIKKL